MTQHVLLDHTKSRMKGILALAALLALTAVSARARETASLDGTWQIVFDHKNEGRTAGWYRQQTFEALPGKRTIQVPNCWETDRAGLRRRGLVRPALPGARLVEGLKWCESASAPSTTGPRCGSTTSPQDFTKAAIRRSTESRRSSEARRGELHRGAGDRAGPDAGHRARRHRPERDCRTGEGPSPAASGKPWNSWPPARSSFPTCSWNPNTRQPRGGARGAIVNSRTRSAKATLEFAARWIRRARCGRR